MDTLGFLLGIPLVAMVWVLAGFMLLQLWREFKK